MALTEAPEDFRVYFQSQLKAGLRSIPNVQVLDFLGLTGGTAVDVFDYDPKCTLKADLCIFIADHTSTGMGMEIAFRYMSEKPMLVFAAQGQRVTRMLSGALEKKGSQIQRYQSVEEIVRLVYPHTNQQCA